MKRLTVAKTDPQMKFRLKVTGEALSKYLEKELSQYNPVVHVFSVRNDNRMVELEIDNVGFPFKFIIEAYKDLDITIKPHGGGFDRLKKKHGMKVLSARYQKPKQIQEFIEDSYAEFVKNVENSYEDIRIDRE